MIVTICYFRKSLKLMFIIVQCSTSLSKIVAHSVTVRSLCQLCDRLNLRINKFVSALWLSVHMKSVVE